MQQNNNTTATTRVSGLYRRPSATQLTESSPKASNQPDIPDMHSSQPQMVSNPDYPSSTMSNAATPFTTHRDVSPIVNNKPDLQYGSNQDPFDLDPTPIPRPSGAKPFLLQNKFGRSQRPQAFRPSSRNHDDRTPQNYQGFHQSHQGNQPSTDLAPKRAVDDDDDLPAFAQPNSSESRRMMSRGFGNPVNSARNIPSQPPGGNEHKPVHSSLTDAKLVSHPQSQSHIHSDGKMLPPPNNPSGGYAYPHISSGQQATDKTVEAPFFSTDAGMRLSYENLRARADMRNYQSAPSKLRNLVTLSPSPSHESSRDRHSSFDKDADFVDTPQPRLYNGPIPSGYPDEQGYPHYSLQPVIKTEHREEAIPLSKGPARGPAIITDQAPHGAPPFEIREIFQKHYKLVNSLDLNTIMGSQESISRGYSSTRGWDNARDIISKQNKDNETVMKQFEEIREKLDALSTVKDITLKQKRSKTERYNEAGTELQESAMGLQYKTKRMSSSKRRKVNTADRSPRQTSPV